jgi:hypothetical protein
MEKQEETYVRTPIDAASALYTARSRLTWLRESAPLPPMMR